MHLCTRLLTVIGAVLGAFRLLDAVPYVAQKRTKSNAIE
jgi:hypothetical protein